MQSFLSVFRSLAMLEKTVEKCCISLNGRSSRLVVQLHCKFGEWAAGQPRGASAGRSARPTETLSPIQGCGRLTTCPSRTVSPCRPSSTQPRAPTCSAPQHGEHTPALSSAPGFSLPSLGPQGVDFRRYLLHFPYRVSVNLKDIPWPAMCSGPYLAL